MSLTITKTPKCYVGGAFIRSESGRVYPISSSKGEFIANIPLCTRKDLRNAVEAAAKAVPGWARRSPYNRAQILYRLAEMLEARASEMADALTLCKEPKPAAKKAAKKAARKSAKRARTKRVVATKGAPASAGISPSGITPATEVRATIDRIVHFAGWADKYEQVLGSVNPVASSHFNFTVTEPMGIVGIAAPEEAPLLALMTLILPVITGGNATVALASKRAPYPAILLGEMLATSDLPGGVVNLLTGDRADLLPTFATHEHLRALNAVADKKAATTLQQGAAESVKRVRIHAPGTDWLADTHDSPYPIRDFTEAKTVWHPIGA